MIITVGKICSEVDKDTYKCTIEVPGSGKVRGISVRVENEPKKDDEVLVILLDDPYQNDCIYLPLKILTGGDFVGIARQGFKMEFKDEGIFITGKADDNNEQIILKEDSIEIESKGTASSSKITQKSDSIEITSGNGTFKLNGTANTLEISGFSTSVKLGGTVAPTGKGPFCGLPNCLFTGAPHAGDLITGN